MMFMAGLVPRTSSLRFGTAVINIPNHDPVVVAAEAAQFDHMSRGRFMLGIGPGGLSVRLRAVRRHRSRRAHPPDDGIGHADPAHLVAGPALRSAGRVPHACGSRTRSSGARRRLHAEAVPARRAADLDLAGEPGFAERPHRRQEGWGIISANIIRPARSPRTGRSTARRARSRKARVGDKWRVARNIMVAPPMPRRATACSPRHASNRYFFAYIREVLGRVGLLVACSSRIPTCRTTQATAEAIAEA